MPLYRHNLPQMSGKLFITDGGSETTLIFDDGFNLPEFAAFPLLMEKAGLDALRRYYNSYASLACQYKVGCVLESITWRASADWGTKLGLKPEDLADANKRAISLLEEVRHDFEDKLSPMVISGCIGPQSDGYNPTNFMSEQEAEQYHSTQIETFAQTKADFVSALTMTYVEEAIGIAQAAKSLGMPVVISFTVETDGALPSGQSLQTAIEQTDAATDNYPAYYMINCAHPTHFEDVLTGDKAWLNRIQGIRANASTMSHAELDEADELDAGNPGKLGEQYKALSTRLKNLNVLGGCCGTNDQHVKAIIEAIQ